MKHFLSLLVALILIPAHGEEKSAKKEPAIGANLYGISDWSRTQEFVDLMHQARAFGPPKEPWRGFASPIKIAEDGWPLEDFGVVLMTKQGAKGLTKATVGLGGVYTIAFRGEADVRPIASRGARISNRRKDKESGFTLIDLHFMEGADQLMLSFTNTKNIKDVRVIRPGYDWRSPPTFTKQYLEFIEPYAVLRFMDWLVTNEKRGRAPTGDWSKRPTLETRRTRSHAEISQGQPWERILELANLTGKDIWINVPLAADENYILQLAKFMKDGLKKNQKIYVEYSNEVWNWKFAQTKRNVAMAQQEIKANPDSVLDKGRVPNEFYYGFRRFADRTILISNTFRQVFGDDEMMTRIRPILAWQIGNIGQQRLMLEFVDQYYPHPPRYYFYALGGSPYVRMPDTHEVTAEEVISTWRERVDNIAYWAKFEKNAALRNKYGLKWIAYEGGNDAYAQHSREEKGKANRDPRLQQICQDLLTRWREGGGELFMWFSIGAASFEGRSGAWSITEDLTDRNSPKVKCLHWAIENL